MEESGEMPEEHDAAMPQAGEEGASKGASGSSSAKKKSKSERPTFNSDPRFERLAPIFGLSSAAELDTEPYTLDLQDFKKKAVQLKFEATGVQDKPGSVRAWRTAVDLILLHADAAAEKAAAAAAQAEGAGDVEVGDTKDVVDADEELMECRAVIEELLLAEEDGVPCPIDESQLTTLTNRVLQHVDDLAAGFRARLQQIADDGDKKVSHIIDTLKVITSHSLCFRLCALCADTLLVSSFSHSQEMGFRKSDQELNQVLTSHNIKVEDPATAAQPVIDAIIGLYNHILAARGDDAKSKLLHAYSRMAAEEERLTLTDEMHTKTYSKSTLPRGRRQFLHYLENTGHVCMETTTTETVMEMYSNPAANLVKIVEILSSILPVHAEEYLAIFTSKNLARRAIIIEVAGGRKVTTCAGHSAACSARSAAASLWAAVDQTSPWTAIPADPRRGSGCPFYHKRVTRALMNKKKMDLREGRGTLSAQLVYIEDHVQFYNHTSKCEVLAFEELRVALNDANSYEFSIEDEETAEPAEDDSPQTCEEVCRHAYAKWGRRLLLPAVARFATTAQREGGQRAEISNLLMNEVTLGFDCVTERPTITKKRQGGTRTSEACQMRHRRCGPYCHASYVLIPDVEVPPISELAQRAQRYLQLHKSEQGICGACSFVMLNCVLNVVWHSQNNSSISSNLWPYQDRNAHMDDPRNVYLLPSLRFFEGERSRAIDLNAIPTAVFSPLRDADPKPHETQTFYVRLQMSSWENGVRITQFGGFKITLTDFNSHGNKKGAETDLGASEASPALTLDHGHHEGMSTGRIYQVWELQSTDLARSILCQPRQVAAGLQVSGAEILRTLKGLTDEIGKSRLLAEEREKHRDEQYANVAKACLGLATNTASLIALLAPQHTDSQIPPIIGQMHQVTASISSMLAAVHIPNRDAQASSHPAPVPTIPQSDPFRPSAQADTGAKTGDVKTGDVDERRTKDTLPKNTKVASRANQPTRKCVHPECEKMLKKEIASAHERKCRQTVDPDSSASSGTDAHIDVNSWIFMVAPDGGLYCGKNHGVAFGSEHRGCRRPFGSGPGFCNKAAQMRCRTVHSCDCGASIENAKRGGAQRCICSLSNFVQTSGGASGSGSGNPGKRKATGDPP